MILLGICVLTISIFIYYFMHSTPFGASPAGKRLVRIQRSPHFVNGRFQNLSPTPALTEGASYFKIFKQFLFDKSQAKIPPGPLPSVRTDLLNLFPEENILVWFGHSSYFMQIDRRTFLVDPVFSGNASPLPFTTKSFDGSDIYTVSDFPAIDYLFITHDHWDHLDFKTVSQLKSKVGKLVTSLGVGAHLEAWGFDHHRIAEMEWNEKIFPETGIEVSCLPARHFSGRGFKRNRTIWSSFVLKTESKKIYLGGDSGYDNHFAEIGKQYGPFDLAILENGQYDNNWKYIHMKPEETAQASLDLKAKKLLPVHWAKFNLSVHAWDDPIIRIKKEADLRNVKLLHPMIGQKVDLDSDEVFRNWWEAVH